MININKILVAVELDKESEIVLEYGISLGLLLDAEVKCVHILRPAANKIIYENEGLLVTDPSAGDEDDDIIVEGNLSDLQNAIDKDFEKLRSMISKVQKKMSYTEFDIMASVRPDFAATGILEEAKEISADIIIVGSHVDFRKKEMEITNLSREIISRSPKSVIVVPSTYGNRNLDHICQFVNFEFEELSMIQDMIEIATKNELKLTFLHIVDVDEKVVDIEKKMKVYKRLFLQNKENTLISFNITAGKVDNIIENLTNEMGVDLIGIKTKKKHWNLFGLQDSFDNTVMDHLRVPLYIWKK